MALAGELAKYVGGELTKTAGKEVAKAGAKSALANLIADTGTKAVAKATEKSILNGLVPSTTRKLASGVELGSGAIPLFRGQTNRLDRLDYNKGLSPNSNGFFMTPNKGATDSWAGKGVVSVNADPNDIMTLDELRSLKKSAERYFRDPKYQMELYNTNPTQAEIYDALEAGDSYQELSRLTGKPFIERDGGQGTELGEVVFFPDTKPELTSRYNADLASGKNQWLAPTEDVVASETAVPVGTKMKFDKDLNIKDIEKPSRGRGWYADNETNPHISQVVKQNGLDKYLGEPKVSQSLVELSPIVADENGVAKTFYHGSPSTDITDFDINMAGKNTRSGERAIWFTDDYPTAEEFSYERIPGDTLFADKRGAKGKVYERNLGLENPLDLSNLSDKQIEELYNYADSRMAFDGKENFIRRMKEFRDAGNDQLIKSQLDMKKLSNSEYDGIVAKMYPGENEVREIGVFDPRKIKNVDSLNPTNNPDIRYAKKNGPSLTEIANRLKAMNKAKDLDSEIKRIGNSEVAEIDASTLPAGYGTIKKYLEADPNAMIEGAVGAKIDDYDVFPNKLKEYIEGEGYEAKPNVIDNLNIARRMLAEQTLDELNMEGASGFRKFLETRSGLQRDNPGKGVGPRSFTISANKDQLYQTDAAKLDREYSDRLGIGRSHTPMSDKVLSSDAQGYYMGGGIGVNPLYASGESGVSTIAHERLHAWQDINKGDWDSRVGDAIDELRDELKKHYHTKAQIKEYRKSRSDLDYYADRKEQEARMLQSYLDNEGYTKTWRKQSGETTEWGDEIKPAFDKFFEKLRELSKKGVALPAIAGLVGIGAASGEKDEKSLDNIE